MLKIMLAQSIEAYLKSGPALTSLSPVWNFVFTLARTGIFVWPLARSWHAQKYGRAVLFAVLRSISYLKSPSLTAHAGLVNENEDAGYEGVLQSTPIPSHMII